MNNTNKSITTGIVTTLAGITSMGWLGLRKNPAPFKISYGVGKNKGTVPIPKGLPAPVKRFAEVTFGSAIPVIESAVISGTGRLRIKGINTPARFKFYFQAGQAYYHYIQVTWFGQPVVTVNERYQDGVAIMDVMGARTENDPNTNSAANLGLWAESVWLPSVFFTDPRVRWEPIDANSALLRVPYAAPEEGLTVTFDPETGLIDTLQTQRYREPDDKQRIPWLNRALGWDTHGGVLLPVHAETQWKKERPWATWHLHDVRYNVDISKRMKQFGGSVD